MAWGISRRAALIGLALAQAAVPGRCAFGPEEADFAELAPSEIDAVAQRPLSKAAPLTNLLGVPSLPPGPVGVPDPRRTVPFLGTRTARFPAITQLDRTARFGAVAVKTAKAGGEPAVLSARARLLFDAGGERRAVVGNWLVTGLIGQSKMSETYRVVDLNHGLPGVLKVLIPEDPAGASKREQEFFRGEYLRTREAAEIQDNHVYTPRPLEYLPDARPGLPGFVQEFASGVNLLDHVQSRRPKPKTILWYGVWLARYLIKLHNLQIPLVHRDIKPENILIDDGGRLALIDFGISQENRDGFQGILGATDGYAPPEQYRNASDARSDLYALAATLLHLLTGRSLAEHGAVPSRPEEVSARAWSVITDALNPAPENRISLPDQDPRSVQAFAAQKFLRALEDARNQGDPIAAEPNTRGEIMESIGRLLNDRVDGAIRMARGASIRRTYARSAAALPEANAALKRAWFTAAYIHELRKLGVLGLFLPGDDDGSYREFLDEEDAQALRRGDFRIYRVIDGKPENPGTIDRNEALRLAEQGNIAAFPFLNQGLPDKTYRYDDPLGHVAHHDGGKLVVLEKHILPRADAQ